MNGVRILLVEDDEGLCEVVERNLRIRGYEVSIAPDVQSALEQLRADTFDLVFLDINLPDQTGWDMLRIAANEHVLHLIEVEGQEQKLPVVVLSAVRVSQSRLAEFHPLAYLPKPFPLDALLRLASEVTERKNSHSRSHSRCESANAMPVLHSEEL